MQEISENIVLLIVITTVIFLLAPLFIILYIIEYNRSKKRHAQEKILMQSLFKEELIKTQLEVQEQVMQTIGINLHDNIGQILNLISLTLGSISSAEEKTNDKIASAVTLTHKSIEELRLLGKLIHGEQVIASGLKQAIAEELKWLSDSGIFTCQFNCSNYKPSGISQDKKLIIFRIVQEVLNNIVKHSSGSKIWVDMDYREDHLSMEIRDNGMGFDFNETIKTDRAGMGLKNILKRTELIKGKVVFESAKESGTNIKFEYPY